MWMVPSLPRILLNHDVAELRNTDGRELSSRIRVRGGPPLNIWTSIQVIDLNVPVWAIMWRSHLISDQLHDVIDISPSPPKHKLGMYKDSCYARWMGSNCRIRDEIDLAANPVRNYFGYEEMPHIMIRKSMQRLLPWSMADIPYFRLHTHQQLWDLQSSQV